MKQTSSEGEANVKVTANGANVYALIVNYELGCSITINGGNYSLDYASDCLIYSGVTVPDEGEVTQGVVVNDGTFYLGNIGTGKNQSPWMFNAKGQNTAHVIVNGGTFNSDIQHQYYPFEVLVPKELALVNNNGQFTVVDAEVYVTEQEFSGRWYTNEIGYATVEEAETAIKNRAEAWKGNKNEDGLKISWDGQTAGAEKIISLTSSESNAE